MIRKRQAMTLIEMVICLAIIALCMIALVRVGSNVTLFSVRQSEEAVLMERVENLIVTLENRPPEKTSGILEGAWRYRTYMTSQHYVLEVWRQKDGERHAFLLREGPL